MAHIIKRLGADRSDLQQLTSHDIHADFITLEESSALRPLGHLIQGPIDEALGTGICIRNALEEIRSITPKVALREHSHQEQNLTSIAYLDMNHTSKSKPMGMDQGDYHRRVRRVADFQVLPLLLLGFATYQLDRTNISSALTGGFAAAIGVDQNTINLGNQLMFLGVIILEIPSNILLHSIGPRWWIGGQVLVFGVIAALQIFVRNRTGFLITRAILGLAEAGYIPGAMYTLSTWYTKQELTKRIAIFFFGMFGGTAVSPLLASALLNLDGKSGLSGWQWIFLVEGLWSIGISIMLLVFLPERKDIRPNKAPYNGNPEDKEKLPGQITFQETQSQHIPLKIVWKTLANVQKWPHFLATACVFATWSPLTTYTPSIVMSLGFSRIEANALTTIGLFITLPVTLFFAWLSDKTNRRGLTVMMAITSYLISIILLRLLQTHVGKWGRFGLWTTVNGLAVGYHPIHNSWIQMNCKNPAERSISVAYAECVSAYFAGPSDYHYAKLSQVVMTATAGLMAGQQIFRQDESSAGYPRGLVIMIALVLSGLVLVAGQIFIYFFSNRRKRTASEPTELDIL